MEQLCIPRVWLVFFLGYIVEVIHSIVEHIGDDEGTFLGQSELVRSFLNHSEHKVSLLKRSTFDIADVESMQILLINGRPNQSHLAFFFQEIDCILACLLCFGF